MVLKNITKKTIISKNLKEARSLKDKFLGLHNKSNPRSLLFKTRFGIHTFFLKEAIDVVILNKNSRVVRVSTIKPNKIFLYNPLNSIVIELPINAIKKSKTSIGDKLNF